VGAWATRAIACARMPAGSSLSLHVRPHVMASCSQPDTYVQELGQDVP
jgi:hypothetical protein